VEQAQVEAFVDEWVEGWNSHDLTRVLGHFADNVTFTSPVASLLLENSDGVIRGKEALREYWREGLRRIPDLHFEVLGTYVGVHTLVINCQNQKGALVSEVLEFENDTVIRGHGTYLGDTTNPAAAIATPD
jgi:ketosteroid isomerase-like protein